MTMRLVQLLRYPVKSMQGEVVPAGRLERDGLEGDRRWGVRDERTGRILTARRAPELLFARAVAPDGVPLITLPTGASCRGPGTETDSALSQWLGRPVRLVAAAGSPAGHAEYFADATDDASEAVEWTMPTDRFVDAEPLLVLTTASLRVAAALHPDGDWHPRRFRPNLLVEADGDAWAEDSWYGQANLRIGDVVLAPQMACVRCTMVTRAQPGIAEDRDIFRTLARHHGGTFGAWTTVVSGGHLQAGDPVRTEPRAG
jgi:uncharacterized protein YcbX